jgi:hypothetical protein
MTNLEAADLAVAWNLLGEFERTEDHLQRLRYFEHAIDLLDQYAEEHPHSGVAGLARRIQNSYTRKLLEELPSLLGTLDISDWYHYSFILQWKIERNVEILCNEQPTLKRNFEKFYENVGF